ncbi:hypothetical protein [Hydrogenophaga sp.]|uniref:hypothetical protein n=1 Tax=Hydrogenophaga sp. TaxID=1904254 RepID=UPI0025C006BA|nr:hypothetical protein [Hydrogenophaga sp.]
MAASRPVQSKLATAPAAFQTPHNPSWQCVLICWGNKYSTRIINNLARSIATQAASVPRFVLISDCERDDVLPGIRLVRFPEHWISDKLKRSGCQAKLVMFEQGIVPVDLPAIYVDLDTIVLGDLSQGLCLLENQQTVAILQSAIIPFGWMGRFIYRCTQGRRYARGNSSFVIYHPAACHYIAEQFKQLLQQHPNFEFRPMVADERFMSWAAQPHMKRIPRQFAVKFPGEYMFPWGFWLYLKAWLPWVRARRRALVAVTLNGLMIKPERLLSLREGDVIVDEKSRKLIWSRKTLGQMQSKIKAFYADSF